MDKKYTYSENIISIIIFTIFLVVLGYGGIELYNNFSLSILKVVEAFFAITISLMIISIIISHLLDIRRKWRSNHDRDK